MSLLRAALFIAPSLMAGGGIAFANPDVIANADAELTGADRDAIGNHVRPCWTIDTGVPGVSTFSVELVVTTDATGTVRSATVAPKDQSKVGDPIFNAYSQHAIAAVMNYQCATFPLPAPMLGEPQTFLFDFTP